jgi:hypothetical protein
MYSGPTLGASKRDLLRKKDFAHITDPVLLQELLEDASRIFPVHRSMMPPGVLSNKGAASQRCVVAAKWRSAQGVQLRRRSWRSRPPSERADHSLCLPLRSK